MRRLNRVDIDEHWDHLKAMRTADYRTPKDHPDVVPTKEIVLLWEHFREAQRLRESAGHGSDFLARLKSAEAGAQGAEKLLRQFASDPAPEVRVKLDRQFDAIGQTCVSCHKLFRDRLETKGAK